MAKRPMPVPRNLGGVPGPRMPPRKPQGRGPKPMTIFAAVLLVLLLTCACIAGLAHTGPDGASAPQSHLSTVKARPNYTYATSAVALARWAVRATATWQPTDHGHAVKATREGEGLNPDKPWTGVQHQGARLPLTGEAQGRFTTPGFMSNV